MWVGRKVMAVLKQWRQCFDWFTSLWAALCTAAHKFYQSGKCYNYDKNFIEVSEFIQSTGSFAYNTILLKLIIIIIIMTHYEKSDWSRAFNQFTIACELDMINVISAADITFIMSMSAWLLSPLVCSPPKQNGWTLRFCFWGWIMWKMYNKTIIIEFGFRMISWIIKPWRLCYLPQPSASVDNTDLGFDNSWYHAQPHPIIVYYCNDNKNVIINTTSVSYRGWEQLEVTCNPVVHHASNLWNVEGHENERGTT